MTLAKNLMFLVRILYIFIVDEIENFTSKMGNNNVVSPTADGKKNIHFLDCSFFLPYDKIEDENSRKRLNGENTLFEP